MAWLGAVTGILGPVTSLVGTYLERRGQVAEARHQAKMMRIASQEGSWKDEYTLIIWSWPVVSMFIPIPYIQNMSFNALDKISSLPQWYLGGWVAISLAVMGADKLLKIKK
jgi:hypothetical protein